MKAAIAVAVEEPAWRKSGVALVHIRSAIRLALLRGLEKPTGSRTSPPFAGEAARKHGGGPRCELTLLLTHDERLRALNLRFRGKDAPTNVLSFRAAPATDGYRGDVAIALGVAQREAAISGVGLLPHTLHLAVHGVLHLLGYDHVLAREARIMERLEIAILQELGIPSPYARTAAAE